MSSNHTKYIEQLLSLQADEFVDRYMGKSFFYKTKVPMVEKLGLSAESIIKVMSTFEGGELHGYWTGGEFEEYRERYGTIRSGTLQPSEVAEAIANGVTIQMITDDAFPALSRFASSLIVTLGLVAKPLMMVWVGTRASGMDLHYDQFDVFQFQVSGKKRWTLSAKPFKDSPVEQATAVDGGRVEIREIGWDSSQETVVSEDSLETVVMEPGSFLYLPAGSWHRTEAEGDETSISVAIAFDYIRFPAIMGELISEEFGQLYDWRRMFPNSSRPLQKLDDKQRAFVSERAEEVINYLRSDKLDSSAWAHAAMRTLAVPGILEHPSELAQVSADTQLNVTHTSPIRAVEDPDGTVTLYVLEEELRFEAEHAGFALGLADQVGPFTASEALGWVPEVAADEVYGWLGTLVDSGVLVTEW